LSRSVPLYDVHKELGATFGEFAGWTVPMSYTSTIEEHMAVRQSAGIFDISHMGRLRLRGPDAAQLLDYAFTKVVSATKEGFMSGPTLALNEHARVIDDEMWYRLPSGEWLAVPNAAARERMKSHLSWLAGLKGLKVEMEDLTEAFPCLPCRALGPLRS